MTWRCAVAVAVVLGLLTGSAGAAPTGSITTVRLKTGGQPRMVVTGPDGNLWVTITPPSVAGVARVDPANGSVTLFRTPNQSAGPNQITAGPDGALWFTESSLAQIGRITTSGKITEFPVPAPAQSIATGPDHNIWITHPSTGQISRVTPSGRVTTFSAPGGTANSITAGPDGALWYTGLTSNKIGRIDTAGVATEFSVSGGPAGIATGRDGNLWFTQTSVGGTIGRITPTGTVSNFSVQSSTAPTNAITLGPDGLVWFTENSAGRVGRMDIGGQVAEFDIGVTPLAALGRGPDNAVWVPEPSNDALARVDAGSPDPVLGKSFTAIAESGTVLVKIPGAPAFEPLGAAESLPIGSIVDARKGRVRLYATSGGKTYFADFYEGEFKIEQLAKKGATADLKLFGGSFAGCPKAPKASAAKSKNRSIRHLWGSGSGPFRTIGRFASASVRGTTWLTDDRCTGTLVKVTAGSVKVRDFVKRRNVVIRARHQYFAQGR